MLRVIDVTLRDGGYKNAFSFTESDVLSLIQGLRQSGLHLIEIGYYGGPLGNGDHLGLTAHIQSELITKIKQRYPDVNIVVMLHPQKVDRDNLIRLKESGVDLLRMCIRMEEVEKGLATVREADEIGLRVSANFVRATTYSLKTLKDLMRQAEKSGAHLVYFADSIGNMIPEQVREYVSYLKRHISIPIGFHAHNNLQLALPNTLEALKHGIDYIDTSLRGMGKGAGNLATEVYFSYLERTGAPSSIDYMNILQAADYLDHYIAQEPVSLKNQDALFGMANLSSDCIEPIKEAAASQNIPWELLAYKVGKACPSNPNPQTIHHLATQLTAQKENTS